MNDVHISQPSYAIALTDPWVWLPPAIAFIAGIFIYISGNNTNIFLFANSLSRHTGDILWANITVLGDTWFALALLGVFVPRAPQVVFAVLIAGVLAVFWTHGLKGLMEMPRPALVLPTELIHVIGPVLNKHSFPSGHSTTVFAFASVVCLLISHPLLRSVAILIASAVAVSRLTVGAHWPLDVLGGAFGGWISGVAGISFAQAWPWGMGRTAQRSFAILLLLCAAGLFLHDTQFENTALIKYGVALAGVLGAGWGLKRLFAKKPMGS